MDPLDRDTKSQNIYLKAIKNNFKDIKKDLPWYEKKFLVGIMDKTLLSKKQFKWLKDIVHRFDLISGINDERNLPDDTIKMSNRSKVLNKTNRRKK